MVRQQDIMRVGTAQIRPAWLNKARTAQLVIDTIAEAAAQGISLLVFSETFLSGYPFWVCRTDGAAFGEVRQHRAYSQFLDAAVEIDAPEIRMIAQAARDYGVSVYLGMNERGTHAGRGTVWCSLLTIHAEKGVLGTHRKLMPTHDERLCWGAGDAKDLRTHEISGWRVGGLNCWENWIPLARVALYEDGEELHVSVWPGNSSITNGVERFIAHEGRVWTVNLCGILSMKDIPNDFEFYNDLVNAGVDEIFSGGATIVDPFGQIRAEALPHFEGIMSYDIDLDLVRQARHYFDPAGHYSRPDIFKLDVARNRLRAGSNLP